jgi:uncharacterized protein (UPF0335 family)|tara:strand:- start:27 stop:260 length:234 start_codon:yes stop_codon:yes gene_type:complete
MTTINSADLLQIITKIENIEREKVETSELLTDAYNEAKSMGYDVKIIKHVLKLRKKDKDALAEEDSLIELYRGALGV